MNPIIRLFYFLSLVISILISVELLILFLHIIYIGLIVAFNGIWIELIKKLKKIWYFFPVSAFFFFSISTLVSENEISYIFHEVIKATIRYFGIISLMLTFTLLSKNDDIISALRNLNYRLFIKSKIIDQIILFIDLVIRFYPGIISQWKNLERGQKAISGHRNKTLIREKIKSLSENIPDFIIINLSKTDILTRCMVMRGYGKKNLRTAYPFIPIKAMDYFNFFCNTLIIFGFHFVLKI